MTPPEPTPCPTCDDQRELIRNGNWDFEPCPTCRPSAPAWASYAEWCSKPRKAPDRRRAEAVWRRAFELLATWNKANGDTDQRDFDDAFAQAWGEVHRGK